MSEPGARLVSACGRFFVAVTYLLVWLSVGLAWPMERVGDAFQLLGLAITALGVAVVPGWLAAVETWIVRRRSRLKAALAAYREWIRRKIAAMRGHRSVTVTAGTAVGRPYPTASTGVD